MIGQLWALSQYTLLDVQSDVADALFYLAPLDSVFYKSGLVMILIGFLSWATHTKHSEWKHWGFRLLLIGIMFAAIGLNLGAMFSLILFVLDQ